MRSRLWCTPHCMWPCFCMGSLLSLDLSSSRPLGTLSSSYCSNTLPHLEVSLAISAPHLPSLSISLPFIFKEHLPPFFLDIFLLTSEATSSSRKETYRLRAQYDQTYLCLSVCPQPPGKSILKPPGKCISHYLDVRLKWLRGWGWEHIGLGLRFGFTILALIIPHWVKYITFLDSVSQTQSEEYQTLYLVSSALNATKTVVKYLAPCGSFHDYNGEVSSAFFIHRFLNSQPSLLSNQNAPAAGSASFWGSHPVNGPQTIK